MRALTLSILCLGTILFQAQAQSHWSYRPPVRPSSPKLIAHHWPRDTLDHFILGKLEANRLAPAKDCDRVSYVRRVTLDLTGLPPTPSEVQAFVADTSLDAYPKLVDRLLASPRYGERMASDWLDVARYADTYGYQNDADRRVWPWRDWVIESFNQNLPYDQFATWQIAGDLLPKPTRDQRLATTFNRLHRQTNEGGSVDEEYRVEYVADRLHTFGMAFLGMTLECARCHDHKFDPITQRDYYALSAYFDDIDEAGLYSHFTRGVPTPALLLPTSQQEEKLQQLSKQIKDMESAVKIAGADSVKRLAHFKLDAIDKGKLSNEIQIESLPTPRLGQVHEDPSLTAGRFGQALRFSGENNATFPGTGEFRRWDPFSLSLWLRVEKHRDRAIVMHRSKAWTDAASCGYQVLLEEGKLSFSLIHFWPGDAIRVRTRAVIKEQAWVHIGVSYDGSSQARGVRLFVDGKAIETDVIRDHLTKDIVSGGGLVLTLGQRFRDRGLVDGAIDDLQVFAGALDPIAIQAIADGRSPELAKASEDLRAQHEALRKLRQEHGTLVDRIPSIMTMAASAEPRDAFLLARGSYSERRERVVPSVPAVIGKLGQDMPRDRLALARWLTHPNNPLTARVAVNRLWQILFGRGIVATSEDFGVQGNRPSHTDLLDYLAIEFVQSGWNTKAMLRRIALSSTYRQSSRATSKQRRLDPTATFLSRYPSRRLSAESIRDTALLASGLLAERRGGPSVKPYQPAGLWKEKSGRVYKHDKGEGLYRRSLYTFWKRTSPPPSMMIFDAGKREVCIARRQATNTPLQALVMMNDPQFLEASRALAERVMHDTKNTRERIASMFTHLTSRAPLTNELEAMLHLHSNQRQEYKRDPAAASALLEIGEHTRDNTLDIVELATLSIIASTILSFDNTVMQR